ncbi:MAG: photosystem II complex extrinsic protein PsbU [Phormidesmis sp.]
MKSTMKQALCTVAAVGILISSLLFGNIQPAVAMSGTQVGQLSSHQLSSQMSSQLFSQSALLANAGGRELRNSIDDKMATEYGNKIDVNNTNIAAFRKFRGLYPTIAGKVVTNAPYDSVEDVLDIPGLSQVEKDRLEQNIDIFTISSPDPALVEGADRFNNGIYK